MDSHCGIRQALAAFGLVLQLLGKLFDLFGFLDHAHREHIGSRGFLHFFAQLTGELVKPLDSFAELLLLLTQSGALCGRACLRRSCQSF